APRAALDGALAAPLVRALRRAAVAAALVPVAALPADLLHAVPTDGGVGEAFERHPVRRPQAVVGTIGIRAGGRSRREKPPAAHAAGMGHALDERLRAVIVQ